VEGPCYKKRSRVRGWKGSAGLSGPAAQSVSALIFLVSPPDPTTRRHCGLRFAVKRLSLTAQDDGEVHGMNLNIRSRFSEEFKIADKHESAI